MSERSNDHLCLAGNRAVDKMLEKHEAKKDKVLFSDFVIKINRKDKEQTRVMLITDNHLFNIMPNNYAKCKRKIKLQDVNGISVSEISDEFVVHVPDEYDYRFKSSKKKIIIDLLQKLVPTRSKATGGKIKSLSVKPQSTAELKSVTVTKTEARLQEREDILRRKQQFGLKENESDEEDRKKVEDGKNTDWLSGSGITQGTAQLSDFELLKVLGRGAFGKVMQVRKKDNGKIYAMKILKKRAIIARNQVEHTKAERKILQTLEHPFLMKLRFAFQTKEKLYLILDYVKGGELFFHLKNNRRFSEEVAKLWVAQVASALGHLHSLGVLYRDLKPENILLDSTGHVILTDFGLAKDVAPDEKTNTFCGTPEYLAPEIVTGSGHDKAVDWWSLGILLYELTVGIPPFYSQNVNEMYNKIQHGVLRFPPFLSVNCKKIIVAFLNRDPKKRLGSADDFTEIKAHAFFADMDWEKLLARKYVCSFQPKIKGELDTDNFEDTFTSEEVVDSVVDGSALSQTLTGHTDDFDGFTFKGKAALS
jgi:tRNA A-37 threonylcarbamoyl transferase component Bud32